MNLKYKKLKYEKIEKLFCKINDYYKKFNRYKKTKNTR